MKRLVVCFLLILFFSCTHYGKKITINANSHVYYTGNIQAKEANKLGTFLLMQGYFNNTDDRAVQLLKKDSTYVIKFILDEKQVGEDKENIIFSFQVWRQWIEEHVFTNQRTQVMLVNEKLKKIADVTTLEEDERKAVTEMSDTTLKTSEHAVLGN